VIDANFSVLLETLQRDSFVEIINKWKKS